MSQTLEILRQGVWASLTGGWFYDPHQSVFCNIVHLYLWLFLLCTPFVAYLYFPGTWLTWCIYLVVTSVTVLLLKVANMALHRLYDRAQSMSEANIKQHFFKVTKETTSTKTAEHSASEDNEPGIEMKDMHPDDLGASVDKAMCEILGENSMVSIDNVNSIIDLKVDVHRKNSSESIELLFYAPSLISANSQQDQHSLAGTASNSKSIRSSHTLSNNPQLLSCTDAAQAKYISVYPKDNSPKAGGGGASSISSTNNTNTNSSHCNTPQSTASLCLGPRPPHLVRKSSEIVRGSHQRRRLERQSSLDANAESLIVAKLIRQSSETKPLTGGGGSTAQKQHANEKCDNFLHAQITKASSCSPASKNTPNSLSSMQKAQRSNTTTTTASQSAGNTSAQLKSSRLQRHRSSETHDERLKQQQRIGLGGSGVGAAGAGAGLFLPIHHEHTHHHHHHNQQQQPAHRHSHHTHRRGGSGGGLGTSDSHSFDVDDMELGLGGSANIVTHAGSNLSADGRIRALPSWILGSSSEVFIEDDSFTKSDFGIEQLDDRSTSSVGGGVGNNRSHNHANDYRTHGSHHASSGRSANITKDNIYTISAFQLHKRPRREGAIKRRRHSNATTLYKANTNDSSSNIANPAASVTTVRRIKSAALEVACSRPSVSNLCPHPNSVEAISGQQQIRNPQNALLPPPSKCLVRNPHLNLCPKFGGSFGGSTTSSLDFGSTNALIDPVYELKEEPNKSEQKKQQQRKHKSKESDQLEIKDLEADNDDDDAGDGQQRTMDQQHSSENKAEPEVGKVLSENVSAAGSICPHHFLHSHSHLHGQHSHSHQHPDEHDVGQILNDNKTEDDEQNVMEEHQETNCADDEDDDDEDDEDDDDEDAEDDNVDADDEFKDFDYNVEHILQDLEQTHNQLDADLRAQQRQSSSNATITNYQQEQRDQEDEQEGEEDDYEQLGAQALRERLHSTDSETDNNQGSRSPLLSSNKKWELRPAAAADAAKEKSNDKQLKAEIQAVQKQKHSINKNNAAAALAYLENPDGSVAAAEQQSLPSCSHAAANHVRLHAGGGGGGGGSVNGNEADSGCPSSDCEQISASSKDMLLAGLDFKEDNFSKTYKSEFQSLPAVIKVKDLETMEKAKDCADAAMQESQNNAASLQASTSAVASSSSQGKRLGAIPKQVQYREIDERASLELPSCSHGNMQNHNYKRHAGNWSTVAPSSSSTNSNSANSNNMLQTNSNSIQPSSSSIQKGMSRTTSSSSNSNSSHSVSAESFTADIQKMLFLMHGGSVDERGRPTNSGEQPSATTATTLPTSSNQSNMSAAHLQFYQDALKALNCASSAERFALTERLYYREQLLRRSSRQRDADSMHSNIEQWPTVAGAAGSGAVGGGSASSAGRSTAPAVTQILIDSPSSTSVLNNRNVSTATTVSLKGFIQDIINDEIRNMSAGGTSTASQRIASANAAASNQAAVAAILNVEGHNIENYCDYWRPACLLSSEKPSVAPKSYYKYHFKLGSLKQEFKISMDRLELLALFDRDIHWIHIVLSVSLCACVAYLGSSILHLDYYKDIFAFLFCAVIAGSQYSLLKSVQPDAASPIHGFNKTVAYSRAIYFCICSALLLLLERLRTQYTEALDKGEELQQYRFFGLQFYPAYVTSLVLQALYLFLLSFPLIFSLGLFPQINTFLMYFMEQIDMHVFGGNAAGSLLGSFLCVLRSILGVLFLYGPLYAALNEGAGTQHILFSIFCALLVPLGYHLSRSASDFSHIWAIVKNCIMSTYHDDDDELSSTSTQKLPNTSTPKRSTSKHKDATTTNTTNDDNTIQQSENIEMSSMEKLQENDIIEKEEEQAEHEPEEEHEEDVMNKELSSQKRSKSKASSLASSSQTLGKTLSTSKKAITASSSTCNSVLESENKLDEEEEEEGQQQQQQQQQQQEQNAGNLKQAATKENNKSEEHDKISSSSTTNPAEISTLTGVLNEHDVGNLENDLYGMNCADVSNAETETNSDPLPKKLQNTVNTRLKNDFVVTTFLAVVVLGLHCSTVFTVLQPDLNIVLYGFCGALGFLLHYIIPQMRKHMPWLCFARPLLRQKEYGRYEVSHAPKIMWFEKIYIYLCLLERNILFPLLVISALTADAAVIAEKFGIAWGSVIVAVCSLKSSGGISRTAQSNNSALSAGLLSIASTETVITSPTIPSGAGASTTLLLPKTKSPMNKQRGPEDSLWEFHNIDNFPFQQPTIIRNAYSDPTNQYLIVMFTVLFFRIDFAVASETFLIDYFFVSLAFRKCCDFFLKLQFIVTYIAPWQITWGSAFHAFAQPFSVPHSAMLFLQAGISSVLSTPLNPFLGSAIFLTSYVRPIKFWERDYNTRRIDHSNTRLSSQLERDLGADDNNLNSIFYEHLTRSLQHSLCGDLLMGRWGNVNQGDCFVLASDYLNCLVHIIELGNGLCTFQMRGLEFRGTYCQQREVEAITEDVEDNDGCCCCDPGHLPRMLSANAMFSTRWLAWQVVASQYVVEGYSISDNLASATLQVFEYRKVLITYYIKSIIYYVIKNPKLDEWLSSNVIQDALQHTLSRQFVDLDPIFNFNLDEDFDFRAVGISRSSFCYIYLSWINYCYDKRKEALNPSSPVQQPASQATPTTMPHENVAGSGVTTKQPTAAASTTTIASTPNLSSTQQKSQSQQQLRIRPQKSATMSTGSNEVVVGNSVEQMATSHSLANISRQASESAPGLTSSSTPLTRSTKSAPTAHKHSHQKSDYSPSSTNARQEGRACSAEPTRVGTPLDKPPHIKLKVPTISKDSPIVSLCLSLSLLARRSLATASHSSLTGVEFFLHGLHALFKGDFRITSPRDEWVFADMDLLHHVVAPAVKMALKLQQDHITNPDEFRDPDVLFEAIDTCSKDLVISHEADPVWRSAVLRGAPNLLALRHVMEDGSDEYRIIRLTKRFLTFRVIKLNRECVRGLWAGQQQELIYLRNRNPERGSIQNAKQALRNIINSSCDQPIGYPIYVSPLTTSYADTNDQLKAVVGGPITPDAIKTNVLEWWHNIKEKCRQGCSSGSAMETTHLGLPSAGVCTNLGESGDLRPVYISPPIYNTLTVNNMFTRAAQAQAGVAGATLSSQFGSDGLSSMRSSLAVMPVKPSSTTLLAGLLNREQEILRDSRSSTKQHLSSSSSMRVAERERRATLPIASTSSVLPEVTKKDSDDSSQTLDKDASNDSMEDGVVTNTTSISAGTVAAGTAGSPRYTKIYCSSGNLGIGNIINTNPGDYPRKTKGPICLTAAAASNSKLQAAAALVGSAGSSSSSIGLAMPAHELATSSSSACKQPAVNEQQQLSSTQPKFALYEKVIIVDEREIFHNTDQCLRIILPFDSMRHKGKHLSWNGWEPRAGMVGYVIHIWRPNHPNKLCRAPINSPDVYLIEIGENYVPVTANGLKQYNPFFDPAQKEVVERSRRNSLQREMAELRQHQAERGLTPILGSSIESPTSMLAEAEQTQPGRMFNSQINAVSSSSSEDESCLLDIQKQREGDYYNLWKMVQEYEEKEKELETKAKESKSASLENVLEPLGQQECKQNESEIEQKSTEEQKNDGEQKVKEQTLEAPTKQIENNSQILKPPSAAATDCDVKECARQLIDELIDQLIKEQEQVQIELIEEKDAEIEIAAPEQQEQQQQQQQQQQQEQQLHLSALASPLAAEVEDKNLEQQQTDKKSPTQIEHQEAVLLEQDQIKATSSSAPETPTKSEHSTSTDV